MRWSELEHWHWHWLWLWPTLVLILFALLLVGLFNPSPAYIELWFALILAILSPALSYWAFREVLLPRLHAGTAIGYLFLLIEKDIWEFVVTQKASATWQLGGLAGLSLLVSIFYLYQGEVHKVVHERREAWRRTAVLFTIGLAQSLSMGFILSALVSLPLARWQGPEWTDQLRQTAGLFGIFPMALVLQAPVALFVGIVTQSLWEDKPITDAL